MREIARMTFGEYMAAHGDELRLDYVLDQEAEQYNGSLAEYLAESYDCYINYSDMMAF